MRIFNEDKTIELKEYDLRLGHLEQDKLITHIDAVIGQEEQGHYETLKTYPNGGKDVKWVVDVPRVKAAEEHDEVEDIYIYIPYTEVELTKINLQKEKTELEQWLKDHDYIGIKIATGRATAEEYTDDITLMTEKAERINEIDRKLNSIN